jgi:hypothetical protein
VLGWVDLELLRTSLWEKPYFCLELCLLCSSIQATITISFFLSRTSTPLVYQPCQFSRADCLLVCFICFTVISVKLEKEEKRSRRKGKGRDVEGKGREGKGKEGERGGREGKGREGEGRERGRRESCTHLSS